MKMIPASQRVWERIPEHGALVWWRLSLAYKPGGKVYLAVSRADDGGWKWQLRGPEFDSESGYRIHTYGASGSVAGAKRAAERHVIEPHCSNCGTALDTGTADMFHCPSCGDEWHPSLWPYRQSD
jgi:hypothetical protein